MKTKRKIITILILIFSAIVFIACDALITPIKARTNPNDPNTNIQPPESITVTPDDDYDATNISLIWSWSSEGESDVLGFIVIRKTGSEPESVLDGILVWMNNNISEQQFEENISDNPDYPVGNTIYYAVFSYAAKGGDENMLDTDEKLYTDDSGYLKNTQNYDFNGPVYDSVKVFAFEDMPLLKDAYVYYDDVNFLDAKETDADNLIITTDATGSAVMVSCINFQHTEVPAGTWDSVHLRLRQKIDGTRGSLEVAPFNINWETDTVNIIKMETSVVADYKKTLSISGLGGDTCSVDVTDIFMAWRNGMNNNGLRLYKAGELDNFFEFYSGDDGDEISNWPRLRLYYMKD